MLILELWFVLEKDTHHAYKSTKCSLNLGIQKTKNVAPALCLHIKNSMYFWQNPLGTSFDIVCFIFSLIFVTAKAAIFEGQFVKNCNTVLCLKIGTPKELGQA